MNKKQQFENVFKCKWSTVVLDKISGGIKQPGQLLRSVVGISKKVMYQRLKKLERFGYIRRRLIQEKPLIVFYTPTVLGRKAYRIIKMIEKL
jgi:DNA-binding HxlR family transcriptional regulator